MGFAIAYPGRTVRDYRETLIIYKNPSKRCVILLGNGQGSI
jgi:hypothetical protein